MIESDRWPGMLPADPRPWLLASDDPAARWVTLTHLLDIEPANANAIAAHNAVLSAAATERVIRMLSGWRPGDVVAVRDARYRPNVLNLLADMGVGPADDARVADALEDFTKQTGDDGRFLAPKRNGAWVAEWCDHCAVTDAKVHCEAGSSAAAVGLILEAFTSTDSGRGWGHARADGSVAFCPVDTMHALRVLSSVPSGDRPRRIRDAVRSLVKAAAADLNANEPQRTKFLTLPWPVYGYTAYGVLDAVGRYPDVWHGPRSGSVDQRCVTQLLAAFVTANFDEHGSIVVKRPSRGFATLSMARRESRSPLATAVVCVVLRRFEPVSEEAAKVVRLGVLAAAG